MSAPKLMKSAGVKVYINFENQIQDDGDAVMLAGHEDLSMDDNNKVCDHTLFKTIVHVKDTGDQMFCGLLDAGARISLVVYGKLVEMEGIDLREIESSYQMLKGIKL